MTFFEDFHVGDVHDCGSRTVTKEEIREFAEKFDPQPIHVDEAAAARSIYGSLIASGWHVIAMSMRMVVDRMLSGDSESGSLGSPGADEIRWLKPVRADDTLHMRVEVIETTPSRSRPDRGVVRMRYRLSNQRGEDVMTMIGIGIFKRRASA